MLADELRAGGRLLLDPNTFSDDGTSSLFDRSASKDHELLAYLVSDGGTRPYRAHFRDPSFNNLQATAAMCEGGQLADVIVAVASIDPVMGGVDR